MLRPGFGAGDGHTPPCCLDAAPATWRRQPCLGPGGSEQSWDRGPCGQCWQDGKVALTRGSHERRQADGHRRSVAADARQASEGPRGTGRDRGSRTGDGGESSPSHFQRTQEPP